MRRTQRLHRSLHFTHEQKSSVYVVMNEGKISAFQASADWRSARPARPAQHVQRCGHCAYVPKIRTYVRTTCVRTCARGWRVGMMSFRNPPPPHTYVRIPLPFSLYVRACARTYVHAYVRRYACTACMFARAHAHVRTHVAIWVQVAGRFQLSRLRAHQLVTCHESQAEAEPLGQGTSHQG